MVAPSQPVPIRMLKCSDLKRADRMTREELHEQVWAQPMTSLAALMGISDVALAKRCKAANVPVPPRGWWAKKEAAVRHRRSR